MSLQKAFRALNHHEPWLETIQMGAEMVGVPYDRPLAVHATRILIDQISFDPATLEIDTGGVDETDLLEAIADYPGTPPAAPAPQVGPVDISVIQQVARQAATEAVDQALTALAATAPDLPA